MKCNGVETSTSDFIGIEGDSVITHVDPVLQATENAVWIAPGFIDLQVNGFSGVDYNSPAAPLDGRHLPPLRAEDASVPPWRDLAPMLGAARQEVA